MFAIPSTYVTGRHQSTELGQHLARECGSYCSNCGCPTDRDVGDDMTPSKFRSTLEQTYGDLKTTCLDQQDLED